MQHPQRWRIRHGRHSTASKTPHCTCHIAAAAPAYRSLTISCSLAHTCGQEEEKKKEEEESGEEESGDESGSGESGESGEDGSSYESESEVRRECHRVPCAGHPIMDWLVCVQYVSLCCPRQLCEYLWIVGI